MSEQQRSTDRTPVHISDEFRQMIDDEVRQIEQQGGNSTHQLKAGLYEKWVSELLDTISFMCKHTMELEKVASTSVVKLEQKLHESAVATHNFMHSNSNHLMSTKLNDSGIGNSAPDQQVTDFSRGIKEPLTQRLQETQETLQNYLERCTDLQKKIDALEAANQDLKDALADREETIVTLRSQNILTEHLDAGEKSRLQVEMDMKVRELAQETSQRKKLEKRVCKQSEEIKALTQEVAGKHDQVMQQEQKNREVLRQKEKLHMQINYQNLLIDSLRKDLKKKNNSVLGSKNSSPHMSRENLTLDSNKDNEVKVVVEHREQGQSPGRLNHEAEMSSTEQDASRLQKRLEELEAMLRAKDEVIHTMQAAAGPSRSQTLAHIHKMSSDQLRHSLLNKEKEISEQRTLIGQLQEALVTSKNKFDEMQQGDDISYSAALVNEIATEMKDARRQLKFYEEHNRDLSLEVMRIRNDKTEAEQYLERVIKQKGEHLAQKEAEVERLQSVVQEGGDHSNCAKQIATLQQYVEDGAKMLKQKSEQITELQAKLDDMCAEAEQQLKLLMSRNSTLAQLEDSLGSVSRERDALLAKVKSLSDEVQNKMWEQNRAQSEEQWRRHLRDTEDELDSWKKKYEIISTNLMQKERQIVNMKRRYEEEISQAMAQTVSAEKLAQLESEAEELRSQLRLARMELSEFRSKCEDKALEISELRSKLELETARNRESKDEAEKCATDANEQAQKVEMLQRDLEARSSTFRAKEDEMKRLLRMSCENVKHLQELNLELSVRAEAADRLGQRVRHLEAATKEARGDLEAARSEAERLRTRLEAAEHEAAETNERLGQFENELVMSAERVVQLQGLLSQTQQQRQEAADEAASLRADLANQELQHQAQQAELESQLQSAQIERQHFERSQKQLEELCKTLSSQLGGQRREREKYLRGLKQAAVERSQLCQEARQVLAVAREWMSEHRAGAMELRQLRTERERLLKENNALRQRSRTSTSSVLNSWDCGLVDREESGFWSSHWTTQLDEVDQEIETFRRRTESWGDGEEDDDDSNGAEGRGDNGYQSGSSK